MGTGATQLFGRLFRFSFGGVHRRDGTTVGLGIGQACRGRGEQSQDKHPWGAHDHQGAGADPRKSAHARENLRCRITLVATEHSRR